MYLAKHSENGVGLRRPREANLRPTPRNETRIIRLTERIGAPRIKQYSRYVRFYQIKIGIVIRREKREMRCGPRAAHVGVIAIRNLADRKDVVRIHRVSTDALGVQQRG